MWYKMDEYRQVIPCEVGDLPVDKWQLKTGLFPYVVSTVFLNLDHNYLEDGPPVVFETMVFSAHTGWSDLYMTRCSTYPQALWMHIKGVAWMIKRLVSDWIAPRTD